MENETLIIGTTDSKLADIIADGNADLYHLLTVQHGDCTQARMLKSSTSGKSRR